MSKETITKKTIITNKTDYKKAPKIELHCHLDGSLRPESVLDELKAIEYANIDLDVDKIRELLIVPPNCSSLIEYLSCFELPLKAMQRKSSIERFTYEVFQDASEENVKYLELRFAPILHTRMGLSLDEIIESSINGMNKAKADFDIEGGIILCCMKNYSEKSAIDTIKAGEKFIGNGVVGVDLAGPEDEGFAKKFIEPMKLARKLGYNITIHAGEAASGKNVYDAITLLGAQRIGHGIRINDNKAAYDIVKKSNALLEVCPISNVDTNTVENINLHPVFDYLKDGINISINTDNRTVSNTTMTKELNLIDSVFGLDMDSYKKIYYNTVESSFASDEVKCRLKRNFEEYYHELLVSKK
ncbi:adenosine deaminase [Peptostreptococcus sp. D1]|uniref:adenosine deaminase n=1 Tax=Peptostreptococcus sp. D1 TaxID=72304 RepID=UPI0008ECE240|nr:adenosine deaminase [Peptostreptococcus sp. D1]SFE43998.1 adenosine deaminase [Peptostreptococcus sp. D1]